MHDVRWLRWICPACGAAMAHSDRHVTCTRCPVELAQVDTIWQCHPGFVPPGFSPDRRDRLADIEPGHFWFRGRAQLLARTLERVGKGGTALELGCGMGGFLRLLSSRFHKVVAVDAYRASLMVARARVPEATLLEADANRLPLASGQFDLVAALDVLEHVEPEPFLAEVRRLLGPDGHLLLTVPAGPSLDGPQDRAMGHRTRYSPPSLRAELRAAGFYVTYDTHFQFLLFPLLWLVRRVPLNADGRVERSPARAVAWLLGAINDAEVRWLNRWRLPWGSSLVALARKIS